MKDNILISCLGNLLIHHIHCTLYRHILACQISQVGTKPSKQCEGLSVFSLMSWMPRALSTVSWSPPRTILCNSWCVTVVSSSTPSTSTTSVLLLSTIGTYLCRCFRISSISSFFCSLLNSTPRGTYIIIKGSQETKMCFICKIESGMTKNWNEQKRYNQLTTSDFCDISEKYLCEICLGTQLENFSKNGIWLQSMRAKRTQ